MQTRVEVKGRCSDLAQGKQSGRSESRYKTIPSRNIPYRMFIQLRIIQKKVIAELRRGNYKRMERLKKMQVSQLNLVIFVANLIVIFGLTLKRVEVKRKELICFTRKAFKIK